MNEWAVGMTTDGTFLKKGHFNVQSIPHVTQTLKLNSDNVEHFPTFYV